jgi:hypothetical protein
VQMLVFDSSDSTPIIDGPIETSSCGPACTGHSGPTVFSGITLKKRPHGTVFGFPVDIVGNLNDGDRYEIDTLVTWTCAGNPPVTAEYRFAGTFPRAPTITDMS